MATNKKVLSAGQGPQNKKKAGSVDPKGAFTKVQKNALGKMKMGGKMKKAENGTKFGMLSVKAGVDNNPNPTAADRIAGATQGKSSKMKMGGKMSKKK